MKDKGVKVKCEYCGAESLQPVAKVIYLCKKCNKKNVIYDDFKLEGELKDGRNI